MKPVYQLIQEFEKFNEPNTIRSVHRNTLFEVYPWIKQKIFSYAQTKKKVNAGNFSKTYQIRQLFSGIKYLNKPSKTIIFSNSLERRLLNGLAYDKLFSEIIENNNLQPIKLIETKLPSNHFPKSKYNNPFCISRSYFFLKEMLYSYLFLRKINITDLDKLKAFLNLNDIHIDIESAVKKNIAQYIIMLRFLKKHPETKYVFLSVSYSNFGLINACKKLGIRVVEVQHGVINNQHYGYSYSYLPSINQFPDFILTLGNSDVRFFNNSPLIKYINPISVGSYIIAHYLKNYVPCSRSEGYKIAVSLQDCLTGLNSINCFIELAILNPKIKFFFKRRRFSLSYYLDNYQIPNNVIFEEERDIYQLILFCDIHLTAYSSCVIEAGSLGKRNVLYNYNNKAREYFTNKLIEGDFNKYADNLNELNTVVNEMLVDKPKVNEIKKLNANNIEYNYYQNLNNFLTNIGYDD